MLLFTVAYRFTITTAVVEVFALFPLCVTRSFYGFVDPRNCSYHMISRASLAMIV